MDAVEKVIPQLKGRIISFSYRIPTDIVATSDITLNLKNSVSTDEVLRFLEKKCSNSPYVKANTKSLVSLDYEGEEFSAIIDMQWIKTVGNVLKVVLWYDNEWGYSARVLDLVEKIASVKK